MKNWLLPAVVVALAVALAVLVWVNLPAPPAPAPTEPPAGAAPPPPTAAAPATLPAVVDVLDIDPLLDPPAGPASGPIPAGPVVTTFGDDPIPQPVRPASAVTPIPQADDEPAGAEVAPMPREVTAQWQIPPVIMTGGYYRRW